MPDSLDVPGAHLQLGRLKNMLLSLESGAAWALICAGDLYPVELSYELIVTNPQLELEDL